MAAHWNSLVQAARLRCVNDGVRSVAHRSKKEHDLALCIFEVISNIVCFESSFGSPTCYLRGLSSISSKRNELLGRKYGT